MTSPKNENESVLKLIPLPKEIQEDSCLFISLGRSHFSAGWRLMYLPALSADRSPLKREDGSTFVTSEYLHSALILFQFSFELLLKSLIKLKGHCPPKKGWAGHDLIKLLDIASINFPVLASIEEKDRNLLSELSSISTDENGTNDSNLMRLKYGKYCSWLPNHQGELLKSIFSIFQLINTQIQTFVTQSDLDK